MLARETQERTPSCMVCPSHVTGHLGQAVNYLDDLPLLPRAQRFRIKAVSPDHLYPLLVVEEDHRTTPLQVIMNGGQDMRS